MSKSIEKLKIRDIIYMLKDLNMEESHFRLFLIVRIFLCGFFRIGFFSATKNLKTRMDNLRGNAYLLFLYSSF